MARTPAARTQPWPQQRTRSTSSARRTRPSSFFKFADGPEHATRLASFDRDVLVYDAHGCRFSIEGIAMGTMTLRTPIERYDRGAPTLLRTDTEGLDRCIILKLLDAALLPRRPILFANSLGAAVLAAMRARGYGTQASREHGAPDMIATRRDFGDLVDRRIAVTHVAVAIEGVNMPSSRTAPSAPRGCAGR